MPSPAQKKQGPQAYSSEVSLQPTRNCLVNLPSALVSVLVDNNKVAQNVVVELTFLQPTPPSSDPTRTDRGSIHKSVYVGWTGLQSKRKLAPVVGREAVAQRSTLGSGREHEIPLVEIDATFGKLLGLTDGLKVGVLLHTDPPQAHTVHIDPLTPADWEIIELHSNFLEINLLSQIRALPNPTFKSASGPATHPLTLHLSPTSTANFIVTNLTPPPPASSPFAKIAPDAEVIVAPKTRAKSGSSTRSGDSKSVRSTDARSTASPARTRGRRTESGSRSPLFLRGVDRRLGEDWFDAQEDADRNEGLRIWVDWSVLTSKEMRRVTWAFVSIVRPSGLQAPADPQKLQEQDTTRAASRIVAQVFPWEDAPNARHVAVSSQLCNILASPCMAGEIIRLEPAPAQLSRQSVRSLRIFPLASTSDKQAESGLQFGGKSKADRDEAARTIINAYGKMLGGNKLLDGPITDGMILPRLESLDDADSKCASGIIRFDPPPESPTDSGRIARAWLLTTDRKLVVKGHGDDSAEPSTGAKLTIEVMADGVNLSSSSDRWVIGEPIPLLAPSLAGVDPLLTQLKTHIEHGSSVLLTGGRGAGKTTIAKFLANHFRKSDFFYTIYFPCGKFSADETRLSSIKDEMSRLFGLASWGARSGGHTLVILDDVDSVCPVETELQVGNDNGRSRHVSETITSLSRQYCGSGSRVVVLATAKTKEDVNNLIIGGHVVRDIVNVPAPDKETRRTILQAFLGAISVEAQKRPHSEPGSPVDSVSSGDGRTSRSHSSAMSANEMALDRAGSSVPRAEGFLVDPSVDLLDLAGRTDGFMPGDLLLLTSRARSEALIRTVSDPQLNSSLLELLPSDFDAAIKGFTPSSLRNVTLQQSSTTFSSIGGLRSTRQTLLETLQYPTLYAPIFAQCPLRLRSGLLLYGYPGCGKTLLASAVAGECGLNFISVKGPEILNKYIGASEKSVRDLFERAQAARPCVLFFDEFDSIAPKRGHDSTGVTDRVVNQLLTQMDGAEGLSGVYVLAATSRPDLIDPALLRPGRLDKSLLCDMPDSEDRLDILRSLSKKLKVAPNVLVTNSQSNNNLKDVAYQTEGYSGADLQAVIYNAHLEAIHDLLGDRTQGPTKPNRQANFENSVAPSRALQDFAYFRFGANSVGEEEKEIQSAAAKATERAEITSQLMSHRLSQMRARAARRSSASEGGAGNDLHGLDKIEDKEPVIQWEHIERSLAQTRPSISREERRRLAGIYREFIVGRNGEMPSGQGGNEIGGRSSLM